jgi:hypothetical protein
MSAPLRIDELRLRVPGLTREQGRQLANAVAQRLGRLSIERSRILPALNLHVSSGASISVGRMADEIVAGIRQNLK